MDQGMDIVQPWLRELLRPLCCQAYTSIKNQHGITGPSQAIGLANPTPSSPSGWVSADTITTGYLSLFNQKLQKSGLTVEWLYSSVTVDEMTGGSGPIINSNGNNSRANTNGSSSPTVSSEFVSVDRERVQNGLRTTPMWSVTVKVDGELYGSGRGVTKKLARNEAAKVGLGKLGIDV
jgi:ribonuclease III